MKNQLIKKLNINDKYINISFMLGVFVYAFFRAYQYSNIFSFVNNSKSILKIISFLLIIPKLIFQNYLKKDISLVLSLFILTICYIFFGGDKGLLIIPSILVGSKDIDIKKIIRIVFYVTMSSVIIHCLWFILDYGFKNHEIISMFHLSDFPVTNKIMFYDYNMFALRYTCALIQYIYLTDRNEKPIIKVIVLLILSTFTLFISQSRASFIVCVLAILFIIIEKIDYFTIIFKYYKYISIIFSILISFLLMVVPYNLNSFTTYINIKLNGRFNICNDAFDYIGVTLTPNLSKFKNMSKVFGTYMMPDNSYISLLLKWGVLLFIALLITALIIIKNNKETIIDYYISILAIWFIVEYISMEFIMYIVPLVLINTYFNRNRS